MAAADLLFVASGTATLQAAVVGTPMVIVYKVGATTYWIGQLVRQLNGIRLFHHLGCCIGLVNLVAGARIVPELLQHEARVDRLLAEAKRLWPGTPAAAEMRRALRAVRDALGEPGGSRRAAEAVLAECPP
jgi:lipid-A-disaccharide synthase